MKSKDESWAPSLSEVNEWSQIDWTAVSKAVKKLQMRIAEAVRKGKPALAKKLGRLLTSSYAARLLAVKRVTTNKGRKTPGIDGVIWSRSKDKLRNAQSLKSRGYKPQPLRRLYIVKKNGKLRPLGIPTMVDRSMQALWSLALNPIAETHADGNSYGFRMYRSCADAMEHCYIALARKGSSQWVLEGDICGCFDNISHSWLYEHIPMNKRILKAWLNAGYVEEGKFHPTIAGTPQGGIISPILANMTLDGIEGACKDALKKAGVIQRKAKVYVIRYADDFIITGSSKDLLERVIKPAVVEFLKVRNLTLSIEKTRITNINDGFNFLGQNVRKINSKLVVMPSKSAVRSIVSKTGEVIRKHRGVTPETLINKLNPIIRGWSEYHCHASHRRPFDYVNTCIFGQLKTWVRKRHPNKSPYWTLMKYFKPAGTVRWIFTAKTRLKSGKTGTRVLRQATVTKRFKHIKVRSEANPFLAEWQEYFTDRRRRVYATERRMRRSWKPSITLTAGSSKGIRWLY